MILLCLMGTRLVVCLHHFLHSLVMLIGGIDTSTIRRHSLYIPQSIYPPPARLLIMSSFSRYASPVSGSMVGSWDRTLHHVIIPVQQSMMSNHLHDLRLRGFPSHQLLPRHCLPTAPICTL